MGEYVERFLLERDDTFGKNRIFSPREALALSVSKGIEIPLCEVFEMKREETGYSVPNSSEEG